MTPRTTTLVALERLACELLDLGGGASSAIGCRSFVQLGGDSLRAMRFAARTLDELRVRLRIAALLGPRPLRHVLEEAATDPEVLPATGAARHGVREGDPADRGGVTPGETALWFMQEIVGGSPYNLVFVADVVGQLEPARIEQLLAASVRRHEALRTCFRPDQGGLVRQVLPAYAPALELVEVDEASFDAAVDRVATELGRRPLEMTSRPPLVFALVHAGTSRQALVLVVHHILLDGWSVGLLFEEILAGYGALHAGPSVRVPAPQLDALVRWQASLRERGELARQVAHWKQALAEIPTTLELPTDCVRPSRQDPAGARVAFRLTAEQDAASRAVAARLGVTVFVVLLSAYAILLRRYTGQRRFIVGVPALGRPTEELRGVVGLCSNVVPVVIDVDDAVPVDEFMGALQASVARSLDHADVPFDELVRELNAGGDARRNPLVQVVFSMHDQLISRRRQVGDLTVEIRDGHGGGSPFDMALFVQYAQPSLGGALEYASSAISAPEAAAFVANLLATIEEIGLDRRTTVEAIRGIAPAQRARLDALNATTQPYPDRPIEAVFASQAERTPDDVAVEGPDGRCLTYRELARESTRIAHRLIASGVRPGDAVIVAIERSVAEIVTVLAVLRAGGVYVAVDPSWPAPRLEQITGLVRARVAVADGHRFAGGVGVVRPWAWDDLPTPDTAPGPLPVRADTDELAYIAFTSGSTGIPKGVAVRHRGVVRLVCGVDYVTCSRGERFLRFAPLAFDASTLEIWGPLLNGGTIVVHPPALPSPAELGSFIAERRLTRAWLSSGLFRLLAEFAPGSLAAVRQVLAGGDVVSPEHARRALAQNPGLVVTVGYGPTEVTTFTTTHTVSNASEVEHPLPIGTPIPNTRVWVVDDRCRLVPPGAIGELFAGGDGLGAGYVGDAEATAASFGRLSPEIDETVYRTGDIVRLDARGRIRFLGRRDAQVKIAGFRVEPDEVRRVICLQPGVADAAVVTSGTSSEDRQLQAVLVPRASGARTAPEALVESVKAGVAEHLPRYMVPSKWVVLPELPVTANGKLEVAALHRALAVAASPRPGEAAAIDDPAARRARAAMSRVLDRDDIADDDDFFDLGGDSLALARLITQLRTELKIELSLRAFYARPTITHLTELIRTAEVAA